MEGHADIALTVLLLNLFVAIGWLGFVLAAMKAGYRNGYRDGYARGREDQWLRDGPDRCVIGEDGTRRTE